MRKEDLREASKRAAERDGHLAKGFPIATGVIEGACRHLVKDRMDITGARWPLRSSGDTEAYWTFHKTDELKRNHLSRTST